MRTLCEKREVNFSCDTSQTFDTHRVYNLFTATVMSSQKHPSPREQYLLRKLYVRMRSANRFQIQMYYVAYYSDHIAAHGQGPRALYLSDSGIDT